MTRRSLALAAALGSLGGAVLVLSHVFFTPGKYILVPYAAVVLGTMVAVRAERLPAFPERFATDLLSFVLASVALYVALLFSPGVSSVGFFGHVWRLGFVVGVGAFLSVATAVVARPPEVHVSGLA